MFTRFYQGYILPNKFGVDKRKLHLSTLICTGQMQREDAVNLMSQIPYPSVEELNTDMDYFLKKMGWDLDVLKEYIARTPKPHAIYGTEKPIFDILNKIRKK